MTLAAIVAYLDALLAAKNWPAESNGLCISSSTQVSKVAGTVNLSWSALRAAVDQGVDLLFSHHAAWKSTDADLAADKYTFAQNARLSIYVAHDSLDHHPEVGTAVTLAQALECNVISHFANGIGVIVQAPTDSSFEAVERHVRKTVNRQALAWESHPSVGKIAIITGWGARPEWMNLACRAGADTFLSGEGNHFSKLYAFETGLNLLLAGHYATEVPAVEAVVRRLTREVGIEALFLADQKSSELF